MSLGVVPTRLPATIVLLIHPLLVLMPPPLLPAVLLERVLLLMRIGLERQGWRIVFANDICQDKYEMYAAHFEDADDHFVLEDIHELNANEIPTVTLATASFPCNNLC